MYNSDYNSRLYNSNYPLEVKKTITAKTTLNISLNSTKVFLITLIAGISNRGNVAKSTLKNVAASINTSTRINKSVNKFIQSVLKITGNVKKTYLVLVIATISISSKFKKQINKFIKATLGMATNIIRKRIMIFEFTENFASGDTIKINTNKMTVTLNDNNAMDLISGNLLKLKFQPGENELVYSDGEGSRQVKITVRHKNRWL